MKARGTAARGACERPLAEAVRLWIGSTEPMSMRADGGPTEITTDAHVGGRGRCSR